MLENLTRDEEETGISRYAVLQKNSIDGASKHQESLKENGNKKDALYHNQKDTAEEGKLVKLNSQGAYRREDRQGKALRHLPDELKRMDGGMEE